MKISKILKDKFWASSKLSKSSLSFTSLLLKVTDTMDPRDATHKINMGDDLFWFHRGGPTKFKTY